MIEYLQRVFVAPAVLAALLLCGGYFCIRLRLFWIRHPVRACRRMTSGKSPLSAFRAVCLALAGTLGVGNITGVALALICGGAGAIFWMLVSAFFAMAVKYAEVVLAMDTRRRGEKGDWQGGAPYYMRREDGGGRRFLPVFFSALCVVCAVLQGSLIQGNAAANALSDVVGAAPVFCGAALSVAAALILLFARRAIAPINSFLIPIVTGLYLIMCLSVIVFCRAALPAAVAAIFRAAFTPQAGLGGVAGFLFSDAARIGCARGLLSNEAGCGTAPLAHITAEGTTPAGQGLWGIFEVFLDTAVVCTLTALACLCARPEAAGDPADYIRSVFAVFYGDSAGGLVALTVVSFAFATTLTWAFYGLSCLNALARPCSAWRVPYLLLYSAALTVGAAFSAETVFTLTDLLLGVMTLCNLAVLIKKADRVVALSAKDGLIGLNRIRGYAPGVAPRKHTDA